MNKLIQLITLSITLIAALATAAFADSEIMRVKLLINGTLQSEYTIECQVIAPGSAGNEPDVFSQDDPIRIQDGNVYQLSVKINRPAFDIDGDGQTGFAEAVQALQKVTGGQ